MRYFHRMRGARRAYLCAAGVAATLCLPASLASSTGACGGASFTTAPATTDGGQDAPGTGDDAPGQDGPSGFCPVDGVLLCDDFDDRQGGMGPWSSYGSAGTGASLNIDPAESFSPPHSLYAEMTSSGPIGGASAGVSKTIGTVSRVKIEFELRIDSYGAQATDPKQGADVMAIGFYADPARTQAVAAIALRAHGPNEARVIEAEPLPGDAGLGFSAYPATLPGFVLGEREWRRVSVEVTLPNAAMPQGELKVQIDGNPDLDSPMHLPAVAATLPAAVSLGFDFSMDEMSVRLWQIRYDNALVTVE